MHHGASQVVKNLPAKAGGFSAWVGKITWRRKWKPTLVFLPGKSHGQRSLLGYSSQAQRESDVTEHRTHMHHTVSSAVPFSLAIPPQASVSLFIPPHLLNEYSGTKLCEALRVQT